MKPRDGNSGEQHIARELQLAMMAGYSVGRFSDRSDDHVRAAYFDTDIVPRDLEGLVNCASQLFARVDNSEVEWPDRAAPISLD